MPTCFSTVSARDGGGTVGVGSAGADTMVIGSSSVS
jgi:hypothetical protein